MESNQKWGHRIQIVAVSSLAFIAFAISAEVTCRIDDLVRKDVPLLASPDRDRGLTINDGQITRGRPNGRYEKWRLNSYGFRGPEIERRPVPGKTRVLILGASESFGLYESDDQEFPRQLERRLDEHGNFEVINAAMPGMTVHSMKEYWRSWAATFAPQIVVIYPSPLFYLNLESRPKPPTGTNPRDETHVAPTFTSRFVHRAKQAYDYPDFIQKWRDKRAIAALTQNRPESWFLNEAPAANADWFIDDLRELSKLVAQTNAKSILVTHAMRCQTPPSEKDWSDLERSRVNVPRASGRAMVDFEELVRSRMISELGRDGILVVDAAKDIGGQAEYFADLVHFTDEGAKQFAGVIADAILKHATDAVNDAVQ
jgi:lysophospholipase L1-like esterase